MYYEIYKSFDYFYFWNLTSSNRIVSLSHIKNQNNSEKSSNYINSGSDGASDGSVGLEVSTKAVDATEVTSHSQKNS